MRRLILLLLPLALMAAGCNDDRFNFGPEDPGGSTSVTPLKDPDLSWSANSFEATLGAAINEGRRCKKTCFAPATWFS